MAVEDATRATGSPEGEHDANNRGRLNIVTGAFGYTGRYIAQRLLSLGEEVKTLTRRPGDTSLFGGPISMAPLNFGRPEELRKSMQGATTLYNTYWIRFPHGEATYERAVENTRTLIRAAEDAGVRRIVHVSIANASENSPLPYFRGKGLVEGIITTSRLSHAILRPTVIFGPEDILVNNIGWLLRRFPIMPILGSGAYRVQPVFVEDVAELAVQAGHQEESTIQDAAGPEIYTFNQLVRLIAETVCSRTWVVHLRPGLAHFLSRLVGYMMNDVLLTRDEARGLMAELLVSHGPPTGQMRLSHWLELNADLVGKRYASELDRHYR